MNADRSLKELCRKRMVLDWNPLNILCSKYHSYLEALRNNGNEHQETLQKYQDVLLELEIYKFHMRNSEGSARRIDKDIDIANEEVASIDKSIGVLEVEFQDLEVKYSEVKEVNDQNMQYDSIATAILKLEDPEKQKKKLESLKKECVLLEELNNELDGKIEKRGKDFSLSFTALKLLEES